jgi:hypothetical protein
MAANTTDIVTVGARSFRSRNGAPFEKTSVAPPADGRLRAIGSVKVGALHADVTIAGITYGTFDTTVALGAPVTLRCTYDKRSFRLARCANDDVTQTYENYDDPQNTVTAPNDGVDASKGGQ